MKRSSTRLAKALGAAAAVLSLVTAAACGSGDSGTSTNEEGLKEVKVGVIPIVDVAPIYLGQEKGFFEDHGIELTLESGQGGAAIVPGVVSGDFEFGFSNVTSLMLARDNDLPLTVVAAGNSSTGKPPDFSAVVVKGNSAIKSPKDLAGKTVAVNTLQNIGDTTVRESIRKDGGDPSKVKFVELAFPDMPAAVSKGDVDAAWVVEPFVAVSKSQGDRVVSWNLVDTAPDLMISAYFTSEQLEQEDPELVEDFTAAINESTEYADAHPDEVREIVQTYTEIDAALMEKVTLTKFDTEINRESTQKLADLAHEDGLVEEPVDLDTLLP